MAKDEETAGDRLRSLRKLRKLSVSQLAPRVGLSESGVRAHENGQNGLKADIAAIYAAVLKARPDWLLYGIGDPPDDDVPAPQRNFLRAWREFRRMSERELATAAGTTESVVKELERSKERLSSKWLRQLATALNTTEGLLAERDPKEIRPELLEAWSDIPEEKRDDALAMLRALGGGRRR